MDTESETTERLIASVERAVAVLTTLAERSGDLGTNEIARRTGINASTVSRLLATLAQDDLVGRVPSTGRYRLGVGLVRLGNAALARLDLREIVRPHLLALMEATGETSTLSVPGSHAAVTIDFVQSPSTVRSVAEIGRSSVTHATATGKVLLAHVGPLPSGPLAAHTPRTITDPARLAREIDDVRANGWARARGERELNLHAVAVPVLDARGGLIGVLGVQGPGWRFDDAAMSAAVDRLKESAVALSAMVG